MDTFRNEIRMEDADKSSSQPLLVSNFCKKQKGKESNVCVSPSLSYCGKEVFHSICSVGSDDRPLFVCGKKWLWGKEEVTLISHGKNGPGTNRGSLSQDR